MSYVTFEIVTARSLWLFHKIYPMADVAQKARKATNLVVRLVSRYMGNLYFTRD